MTNSKDVDITYSSKDDGITVLGADQPRPEIGFIVNEYNGVPVYLWDEFLKDGDKASVVTRELLPGEVIAVPSFTGYYRGVVRKAEDGLFWDSGEVTGFLGFGEDDRNCWICCGVVNKRGLKKLCLKK